MFQIGFSSSKLILSDSKVCFLTLDVKDNRASFKCFDNLFIYTALFHIYIENYDTPQRDVIRTLAFKLKSPNEELFIRITFSQY